MKLQNKIILILLSVFVIAFVMLGFLVFSNYKQDIQKVIETNLISSSHVVENGINQFLEGQKAKVELIATQSSLTTEELNEMLEKDSNFYDFFVINSNGIVTVSTNPKRVGLDRSQRLYFIQAQNQTYISQPYFALVPETYSIAVSTPFNDGVLVGSMKVEVLNKFSPKNKISSETMENLMAFINDKNEVVYFTERKFSESYQNVVNYNEIPVPMFSALNKEEKIITGELDYRGEEVIAYSNYLESLNIGLVTKIDTAETFRDLKKLEQLTIIIIAITILVVFFITYVLSKNIVYDLKSLMLKIEEITKGKLDIQLDKSRIFEIQQLTNSLNRILASMKLAILRTGISKDEIGIGEAVKAKENAEQKYRRIIEGLKSDYFFYSHDVNGNFIYLSPSVKNVLGYTPNEFLTHYTKYLTDNPINKGVEKYTNESIKGIEQKPYLVEIYHKNKSKHILEVKETPVKDENDRVVAVEGIAKDITIQKKIDEKYKILFDNINDSAFIHDLKGQFLEINKASCVNLGYSKNELLKLGPAKIDSPRFAKLVPKRIKELKQKGKSIFISAHVTKKGKEIPVEISSAVIDYNGEPAVLSIARDISGRKNFFAEKK